MKKLVLIRHAKSSWDLPIPDKDRTLSLRGIHDAHAISLKSKNYLPNNYVIFSSSAKRTVETAILFSQNLQWPLESIFFKDELYTFDGKELEKCIKQISNSYENVILFGHNAAITDFVNKFGNVFIENVPTTGLVSMQFSTDDWAQLGKGIILKTLFPKNLTHD